MTLPQAVRELHYRVDAPVLGHFPGHHKSTRGDSGFEFRGHAPLLDVPDPRRLDLHASLRDPFGGWIVRVHSQRRAIPVVLVADLSASMRFAGQRRKLDVLADFTDSLALSAWRTGDSFGFIGCDDKVRQDLLLLPTRMRGAGAALAARLRTLQLNGKSADALASAFRHLGRQRSLIFLVSDFHLPLPVVEGVLASLARHNVVPVVLWERLEFASMTRQGLLRAVDPETGRRTLVWWRPALRQRWLAALQKHRGMLLQAFHAHRLRPLFIENGFDADAVTRHFHA
ncbi:MAG: MxaS protein [Burkholderiaceae bacterium]